MKLSRAFFLLPLAAVSMTALAQGPLTPQGAPAPAMKSIDQIEPRTPISSLPFVISQPGSYYFTGNLEATPETFAGGGSGAIEIEAANVTLDLNGFMLGSTAAVVNQSAISVANFATPLRSIRIMNGTIRGTTTVEVSGTFPSRTWIETPGASATASMPSPATTASFPT